MGRRPAWTGRACRRTCLRRFAAAHRPVGRGDVLRRDHRDLGGRFLGRVVLDHRHGHRAAADDQRAARADRDLLHGRDAAAAEQLGDHGPRAPARQPAQTRGPLAQRRLVLRGTPRTSTGAGGRSRSRARPPDAASSSASRTEKHDVSRAWAVWRRFARARASSERVVSTVVSSRTATSSCESPSSALITSTDFCRSGRRWMSPSSARASVRSTSTSGSWPLTAGSVVELHVTGDAAHARAAQLVETGVADEAEQPGTGIHRNDARAQGGVRAQVHVLQHIVGVVAAAAQHPPRLPAQHGAMALELGGERVLVATGRGSSWGAGTGGWSTRVTRAQNLCVAFSYWYLRTMYRG